MRQQLVYMRETWTGVATMRTWVVADDLYRTERRRNNKHNKGVRHDGPVPILTPVHQWESSSLALDAGRYSPIYEGGCLALFGKGLMGQLGYFGNWVFLQLWYRDRACLPLWWWWPCSLDNDGAFSRRVRRALTIGTFFHDLVRVVWPCFPLYSDESCSECRSSDSSCGMIVVVMVVLRWLHGMVVAGSHMA